MAAVIPPVVISVLQGHSADTHLSMICRPLTWSECRGVAAGTTWDEAAAAVTGTLWW